MEKKTGCPAGAPRASTTASAPGTICHMPAREVTSRPRLLVLEDEVVLALGLQQDLQDLGYEVPLVTGAREDFAALVERWKPDLLVVGLASGAAEANVRVAHDLQKRYGVGVIHVLHERDAALAGEVARLGAFAYLLRPCDPELMQSIIELALARRRLAERLRGLGPWFFTGLEESSEAVIATDAGLRITLVNPLAAELTGLRDSDVAGRTLDELFAVVDESTGHPLGNPCQRAIEGNKLIRLPPGTALLRRSGRQKYPADCAAPIHDADRQVIGALIVFRRPGGRPAGSPGAPAESTAAANLDALAGVVGLLSRDYNNLLSIIIGNPMLMKMCPRGAGEFFAPLEAIKTSIHQAYLLTGEVLSIARGDPSDYREVDLRKTTNNLLQFFSSQHHVELLVDIPPGLWKVRGDEPQLIQILHNLLVHSRQNVAGDGQIRINYTNLPAGSHEVPVGFRSASPKPFVRLVVAYSGTGEVITELSSQLVADSPTTRGSTALPLATCAAIVRHHSGHIEVRGTEAGDVIFSAFLPALPGRLATPERFERTSSGDRPGASPPPITSRLGLGSTAPAPGAAVPAAEVPPVSPAIGVNLPPAAPAHAVPTPAPLAMPAGVVRAPPRTRRQALVIDDEEMVRNSVAGMLKVLGFHVDMAWDGDEGVAKYQQALQADQPYGIVIADLVVPLGKGAEDTIREILRIDPGARVVVTSGYVDHPVIANYRSYGFLGFLKKPFGIKEIKAVLQSVQPVGDAR